MELLQPIHVESFNVQDNDALFDLILEQREAINVIILLLDQHIAISKPIG